MSDQLERALEREEALLEEDYNSGRITRKEYNEQLRDLHRDARAELEDAAWDAYEQVMDGGW